MKMLLPAEQKWRNWKKYPSMTTKQLKIILNGNCLGDEHIYLVNEMLKESFPFLGGLQPTILPQTLVFVSTANNIFCPVQSAADSIQIHYNAWSHWVKSTVLMEVLIFMI